MEDKTLIGSIDFSTDPIFNEVHIGDITKIKNVGVYVYTTNEGTDIAHMHLIGLKDEICIKIFVAEFFTHGSKQGTLNRGQSRIFDKFMRDQCRLKEYQGLTNWEAARKVWILSKGSDYRGPGYDTIQPDYTKLV